ncbi:MAG: hypothetical protein AAF555_01005 [Verrucomicrobiota bacterium]
MAKKKKKGGCLGLLVLIAIFLVAAGITARVIVTSYLSEAFIVQKLEETIDARVEIGGLKLSFLRMPAAVTLESVKLAPRDAFANEAVPLEERPALEKAILSVEKARFAVNLMDLIKRELQVEALTLQGFDGQVEIYETGGNSLQSLFEEPAMVAGKKKVASPAAPLPSAPEPREDPLPAEEVPEGFNAKSIPIAGQVEELSIRDSRIEILLEANESQVLVEDFSLIFSEVDVDPANLAERNSAQIELAGSFRVVNPAKVVEHAQLNVKATGQAQLFEVTTGDFAPDVRARFSFEKGTSVKVLPQIRRLQERLQILEQLGIDVADYLNKEIDLAQNDDLALHYHDYQLTLESVLEVTSGDFLMQVTNGTWMNIADNSHNAQARLVADESLSREAREQVNQVVLGKAPREIRASLESQVIGKLFDEQGLLSIGFASEGRFAEPKVRITTDLPDFGEMLKEALKGGLGEKLEEALGEEAGSLLRGLLR